jgi:hypothetical protein
MPIIAVPQHGCGSPFAASPRPRWRDRPPSINIHSEPAVAIDRYSHPNGGAMQSAVPAIQQEDAHLYRQAVSKGGLSMSLRFDPRHRLGLIGRGCGAIMLLALGVGAPANAQVAVDLHLVLAVDASGSVDFTRFELQRRGYVAAFRSPQVLQAIRGGENQSIAVAMVQWTGPLLQAEIVPWTQIKDQASANSVAALVETTPRRLFGGGTSISGAIDYAMRWFPQSPFKGERRVIDISGDGSNNGGRSVIRARDEAVRADVNINGLPILAWEPYLDQYYKENVIGGPGAFMIVAKDFDTFADAILKKMIIEIAMNVRPGRTRIGKR